MNGNDGRLTTKRVSALEAADTVIVIRRWCKRRRCRWGGLVDDFIILAEEELLIVRGKGIDHAGWVGE